MRVTTRPVGAGAGDGTRGGAASLETRLAVVPPPGSAAGSRGVGAPTIADPVALFRHFESTLRFHRDTGFGRIYHPGRVSFRENRPNDSLHVIIGDDHIAAHVDRVSPLGFRPRRPPRYSLRRTVVHNLAGMAEDFIQLVRGRQGDHRSQLDCQWLWDPAACVPRPEDLLDPATSAWSVQVEVEMAGELDEDRLRRAVTAVLGDQSLDHDPLEVVGCPDEASLAAARAEFQSRPARMTGWPPLRAALVRRPGGDVFMLNTNHAASDGVDALRLLRIIASAYATGTGPDPPPDFPA
ncbi:MAG: hypothetical protein ACRDY5_09575, partial [Acidimicrobiales bacterium]